MKTTVWEEGSKGDREGARRRGGRERGEQEGRIQSYETSVVIILFVFMILY